MEGHEYGAIDVLVGGTPCQDFSIAGLRAGVAGDRGNLTLEFFRLAARTKPRWLVWENVPGILSVDGGRTFGAVLGALADLGYGFAYRVLDAQYFDLAQRRARVFVVGCLGDWRRAAAVLFEPESLLGHPAPRRQAGQMAHSLRADGFDASEEGTGRGVPLVPIDMRQASRGERLTNNRSRGSGGAPGHGVGNDGDPAFTVTDRVQAVAFAHQAGGNNSASGAFMVECSPTLPKCQTMALQQAMAVRRLTPRECERLQGFPDDYTLVPYRGKPAADGPRYRALGNSMAVPCMAWIGRRIQMVEDMAEYSTLPRDIAAGARIT
jgi:DNA (cytosine-5)-methyltransferase 1